MELSFHELAARELNDAAEFCSHQQRGLGAAFITEVQRCSDLILQYPEAGPIVLGTTCRRRCHRFPYALLYTVRSGVVRILAVMNASLHVCAEETGDRPWKQERSRPCAMLR